MEVLYDDYNANEIFSEISRNFEKFETIEDFEYTGFKILKFLFIDFIFIYMYIYIIHYIMYM